MLGAGADDRKLGRAKHHRHQPGVAKAMQGEFTLGLVGSGAFVVTASCEGVSARQRMNNKEQSDLRGFTLVAYRHSEVCLLPTDDSDPMN